MITKIQAVIFDLDGVLVDSEPIHFETDQTHFARYRKKYLLKHQREFLGIRVVDQTKALKKRWNLSPSTSKLMQEREEIFRHLLDKKLQLNQEAIAILRFLKKRNFTLGLGTSAEAWYTRKVMKKFSLSQYFQVIVNGEQVKHAKPHPDIYLLVAKKLHLIPSHCLVIEDAPNGVTAAKAAGMLCFALPGPYSKAIELKQADKVFASLVDLKTYLKRPLQPKAKL